MIDLCEYPIAVLRVGCPWCKVRPGRPCLWVNQGWPRSSPHQSRIDVSGIGPVTTTGTGWIR